MYSSLHESEDEENECIEPLLQPEYLHVTNSPWVYVLSVLTFFGIYAAFLPTLLNPLPQSEIPSFMSPLIYQICQYIIFPSDFITAICYFIIPFFMFYIYRVRKDIPFSGIFLLFVAFIVCCGATHFVTIFRRWFPAASFMMQTVTKFITAAVSFTTAICLVKSISLVLSVPSRLQLEQEIRERKHAQNMLQEQYNRERMKREMVENIRKPMKLNDIFQITAEQLCNVLRVKRCTVHFDVENFFNIEAEWCQPFVQSVSMLSKLEKEAYVKSPFLTQVFKSESPVAINLSEEFIRGDPLLKHLYIEWKVKSLMAIKPPSLDYKKCVILVHDTEYQQWTDTDIELAETAATHLAIGIAHNYIVEVEKAREIAEKGIAAKSEFLAMMSHEIRTPMNAVIGMIEILRGSQLTTEQRDCVDIMSDSSNALLGLLNNFLDLTKIESEPFEIELRAFSLHKVLRNTVTMMSKGIPADRDVECVVTPFESNLPEVVLGDKLRLQQILINLTSNAIKFTKRGQITITAKVLETLQNGNFKIQIDVTDTGIGIPEEKIERLFKVFSQVDSSITRKYGGSGLGLAISKKLCILMGGDIWVHSVEGQGSTFSFTVILPVASRKESIHHEEIDDPQQWKNEARILLVEDNSVNQLVAKQILRKMGYTNVTVAASGVQAIEKVQAAADANLGYHIILMDLHMPEMDGLTATTNIRSQPYGAGIYIIALSADVRSTMKECCMQAGMNDFLGKPFKQKDLMGALSRARCFFTL